ncbi:hypothetical protein OS493_025551 [Desmophyllum pertusum]|uniref:Uncharacterized protein n=1 Tax=Desmophyllum pertusum TaxID=174260 RepID=A0A9X0CF80_9CNID|nr:hypothetical protein OS493_025551 [Desmophyllum pertusum]
MRALDDGLLMVFAALRQNYERKNQTILAHAAAAGCGWPHGTDGSHDVQPGWFNSCGCRMDGLMEQKVVMICSLDGSTVVAVGWITSCNTGRKAGRLTV